MGIRQSLICMAIVLVMPVYASWAAAGERGQEAENISEVDPTMPVIFNVRKEFFRLDGSNWRNASSSERMSSSWEAAKYSPAL